MLNTNNTNLYFQSMRQRAQKDEPKPPPEPPSKPEPGPDTIIEKGFPRPNEEKR